MNVADKEKLKLSRNSRNCCALLLLNRWKHHDEKIFVYNRLHIFCECVTHRHALSITM